jgi:hypothetical protein
MMGDTKNPFAKEALESRTDSVSFRITGEWLKLWEDLLSSLGVSKTELFKEMLRLRAYVLHQQRSAEKISTTSRFVGQDPVDVDDLVEYLELTKIDRKDISGAEVSDTKIKKEVKTNESL